MASNLQGLTTRLQAETKETPVMETVVERLDEVISLGKDIKKLVSASGAGRGKEDQLKKIKDSTSPLSITRVDGESAGKILSAATDNLSKDLEKFSVEEHKMMTELVKEIGKLTEKNLEGFNKGIKEVVDLAKKGQALAEKSGNTEGAKRFADVANAAKDEHFRQNNMGLRGDKDTRINRLGRLMGLKDQDGNAKTFNTTKSGFKQNVKALGTAIKAGSKEAVSGFAAGILKGKKGSWRDQVFTSDEKKRVEEREKQGWAPQAEKMANLTEGQKKTLAERGIAPASDKDIAYRKEGKSVSLQDINAELEKAHDEKKAATAIIPEKPSQEKTSASIETPVTQPSSEMQEETAGMSDSPVVDALEENTKKLGEISDTLKETSELISAIKEAADKIVDSFSTLESNSGGGGGGSSIIDNVVDMADDLTGGSGSSKKKNRSDRARSQPRDAKGRFVKRGSPDAVKPRGRMGGKGKGLVGLGLGLLGAVGIGSAMSDDDDQSSAADVAANTATTATDLADVGSKSAEKTEAKAAEKGAVKAGEKGAVKAGEKAAVKAGEKVAAKGVAKVGAKAVGKSLLKKIPGVSILAGGAFAAQRAMQGDWLGAGGELLSGVAGTIPGLGTAASAAIDAGLAARDMGAFDGTAAGSPGNTGAEAPAAKPAEKPAPKPAAVQGKPGGGIFSKVGGFIKKNPLMAAAGLGGVGLAAVGASKAWDWMTGGDEPKVQSGQNPDSGILEQGSEKARDKMNVNVPPPTIINQGGGGNTSAEKTTVPNTKSYVRDDESSWMRFALKRAMA